MEVSPLASISDELTENKIYRVESNYNINSYPKGYLIKNDSNQFVVYPFRTFRIIHGPFKAKYTGYDNWRNLYKNSIYIINHASSAIMLRNEYLITFHIYERLYRSDDFILIYDESAEELILPEKEVLKVSDEFSALDIIDLY